MRNICLAFVILVAAVSSSAAEDLIQNGGFEELLDGFPAGWTAFQAGESGASFEAVPDQSISREGNVSMRLTNLEEGSQAGIRQDLELSPGSYTLSCYVRTEENKAASFLIGAGDADSGLRVAVRDVWLHYKFAFDVEQADIIPISIQNHAAPGIPIWVDNVYSISRPSIGQIAINLLNNPPNTGDPAVREEIILAIDKRLMDYPEGAEDIVRFHTFMMEKVTEELKDDVSTGAAIWMMYNHGFLVKTPQVVFAFDLLDGYSGFSTHLPAELVNQIEVLFISHEHGDHYSPGIVDAVSANGGYVVIPAEDSYMGNVPMAVGDSLTISGLHIKAHFGIHNAPVRMYEVTCPNGLKFLHTGDSSIQPEIDNVDVLLLNAWVEIREAIDIVKPRVVIPGHIQELGHRYIPGKSRVIYEPVFRVDDQPIAAELQVMAWGERYFISEAPTSVTDGINQSMPESFELHQNYPNPFNLSTTIRFHLPKASNVVLTIFNVAGQEVTRLADEDLGAGSYVVEWDGSDLASGLYFVEMKAGDFTQVKKAVLVK